jgi:hypothetical protein
LRLSHVADLALQLHEERQSQLHLDLPAGQVLTEVELPKGCKLVDGALEFESIEVRNTIVAEAVYERFFPSGDIDGDELFKHAYKLWCKEIGHSDQASGRLLALASRSVDLLAAGARRIRSGSNVFDVLHLVEAALPYLENLAVSSIIDLMAAKYEPTKNDMVAGVINGALERWLEKRPNVALELHDTVLKNLSEATSSLLGNAIVALSKSDYAGSVEMAKTDTRSDILMQAQVGTWTLGRLLLDEHEPPEAIGIAIEAVIDLVRSELPDLRSQAIRASVGAMHTTAAFDPLLQSLAEGGDQDVLCAAASALFFKSKEIRERGITQRWLQLLTALNPEFKSAIQNLDYALSQMLSNPADAEMVLATLGQWVANHGKQIAIASDTVELFNGTLRALFRLEESWSSLVTDWLLSDRQAHAVALDGILSQFSQHSATNIKLDKSRLDGLSTSDLLFLAKRMLGYVHNRAQVTSLALSMLQSTDAEKRIHPVLRPLLVEEIGYDYPGSTVDALNRAAQEMASPGDQKFLRAAAGAINQVTEAQSALLSINELRPPTRLRRLFSRARAKQMDSSFEEASKNSIFRKIATEIPLKAGAGTFNYRDSSYGPSTKLSSVSHSIELPRREAFDPIGNSIRYLGFRLAKRGEP